ncbi:uncharacterized protein LOC132727955 [Ruditapes philippinarum]|uniref:uncharacterized protein LOC132727955 n=1 Tax=Ruditapes philippinarum TaxID=129788 RepID=UPI00295B2E90|nr:uncharacterized protein LOC132727955 [Ruditapes philippinarum]
MNKLGRYFISLVYTFLFLLEINCLCLSGDGRNDSPGHCSQYCSYTLMEDTTKKILTIKTLDKRMTDRKSVNMEKLGFERGMSELESEQVEVKEVVTDAHLGIGALMKSRYPDKKHSHDIWHVAKNLGKKIVKIAQKKQNSVLLKWSKDIINHFWFACKEANTCSQFVSIWRSVLTTSQTHMSGCYQMEMVRQDVYMNPCQQKRLETNCG